MSHLLAFEECRPKGEPRATYSKTVSSPLMADEWQGALADHPDQEFVSYILSGIREGFRIGVELRARQLCKPAESNMPMQNPELVSEYLGTRSRPREDDSSRDSPASADQPHRANTKERQAEQVETYSGSVLTERGKCQ